MHIFEYILQKLINNKNTIYQLNDERDFSSVMNFWNEIYMNQELSINEINRNKGLPVNEIDADSSMPNHVKIVLYDYIIKNYPKSKYSLFMNNINPSIFSVYTKEHFLNIYCKTQRTYMRLLRFVNLCRHKKYKIQIKDDLYLNPIDTTKRNYMSIIQNNKQYLFTTGDIINILNTALSNAPNFFVTPLIAKNPYTNTPFNKSTLYNIYFHIKHSNYTMPLLIHNYFLQNFNLHLFAKENENIIRDIAIRNHVMHTEAKKLHSSVLGMIRVHNSKKIINIDKDFPAEKLVNIMRPYLLLYFMHKYSFTRNKRINSENELRYKLKFFMKYNPKFGRKYKKRNIITNKFETVFDDYHIGFNKITPPYNYDTSHIDPYNENEYYTTINTSYMTFIFNTVSSQDIVSRADEEEEEEDEDEEEEEEYENEVEENEENENEDEENEVEENEVEDEENAHEDEEEEHVDEEVDDRESVHDSDNDVIYEDDDVTPDDNSSAQNESTDTDDRSTPTQNDEEEKNDSTSNHPSYGYEDML